MRLTALYEAQLGARLAFYDALRDAAGRLNLAAFYGDDSETHFCSKRERVGVCGYVPDLGDPLGAEPASVTCPNCLRVVDGTLEPREGR